MGFFDINVAEAMYDPQYGIWFRMLISFVIIAEFWLASVVINFANYWATKQRLLYEIEKKKKDEILKRKQQVLEMSGSDSQEDSVLKESKDNL